MNPQTAKQTMIDRRAVEHEISIDLKIKNIDDAIRRLHEARDFRIYEIMQYFKTQ